jgi:hypothetical protein
MSIARCLYVVWALGISGLAMAGEGDRREDRRHDHQERHDRWEDRREGRRDRRDDRRGDGWNRRIEISNNTDYEIISVYTSARGRGHDFLGRGTIGAYESAVVNIDDDSGNCVFNLRVVFEDGDEVVQRRYNVCEESGFSID